MARSFPAVIMLASLAASCSIEEREAPVLQMHTPLTAARPSLQTGEDCTVSGKSACLSGICLHVSAEINADFICSSPCPCLSGWSCVDPLRTGESICVPPPTPGARTLTMPSGSNAQRGAGK